MKYGVSSNMQGTLVVTIHDWNLETCILKSFNKEINQCISQAATEIALQFASLDDLDIGVCF